MNFDDFKDQLNDKIQGLKNQILESEAYNTLYEKYVTLPNSTQKLINLSGIATAVISLLFIPLTFFMSSSDNVEMFESERQVIRDLFKASRIASTTTATSPVRGSLLNSRVQSIVNSLNLVAEQQGSVTPMSPEDINSSPSARGIEREGVQIALKKLNLRQVLEASFRLQTLSPSIKLIGISINADKDNDHYFNTTFKLVSYYIEAEPEPAQKNNDNKSNSRRNRRTRRGK